MFQIYFFDNQKYLKIHFVLTVNNNSNFPFSKYKEKNDTQHYQKSYKKQIYYETVNHNFITLIRYSLHILFINYLKTFYKMFLQQIFIKLY